MVEGLALGHIYHRAVGVKRYRVTARTEGGHSWSDYGQPSAVLELSKLVVAIVFAETPNKSAYDDECREDTGGTSINVIPAEAWLELDLRSEGADELAKLVSGVEKLIEAMGKHGVVFEAEVIGERPAGEMSPKSSVGQVGGGMSASNKVWSRISHRVRQMQIFR